MKAMKWGMGILLILALGTIGGCSWFTVGLNPDQKKRVEELEKANEGFVEELSILYAKAKAGTITLEELASGIGKVKTQTKANLDEIKKIHTESGSGGAIWAIIGVLGRTVLHGAAKFIPAGGGPLALGLQGILGLLLGGSQTKKHPPPITITSSSGSGTTTTTGT